MSRCRCNDKLECAKKLSRLYIAADEIKGSRGNADIISDKLIWLANYSANTYITIKQAELISRIKESDDELRALRDSLVYKINIKASEMRESLNALKEEDRIFHEEEARRLEEELLQTYENQAMQ